MNSHDIFLEKNRQGRIRARPNCLIAPAVSGYLRAAGRGRAISASIPHAPRRGPCRVYSVACPDKRPRQNRLWFAHHAEAAVVEAGPGVPSGPCGPDRFAPKPAPDPLKLRYRALSSGALNAPGPRVEPSRGAAKRCCNSYSRAGGNPWIARSSRAMTISG